MNEHEQVTGFGAAKNAAPLPLDPGRTALLVIDMQRLFTRSEEALAQALEAASPGVTRGYFARIRERVIPAIRRLLAVFRRHDAPVFFTAVGTESGEGQDLPRWLRSLDQLGLATLGKRVWPSLDHPAWGIDEALAPKHGEPVLNKRSAGAFASTGIEERLRRHGIETVIVTGVVTDVCVSTTAREAADRGFATAMIADACTTMSDALHKATLESFRLAFGWVRSADEIVSALERRDEE